MSAALFTARNGLDTVVFDTDDTAMHSAYPYNHLGVREIAGFELMEVARKQVEGQRAYLHAGEEVTGVEPGPAASP